jgi:ribosomal protein S18 acetylase RimI-like enzyme
MRSMAKRTVPAWRLRPITDADFDWAFELHKAALGDYVEQTWGWDETLQRRMFAKGFRRKSRQVIEAGGQDIGVLLVEERPDEVYLGLLELLPAWQNKGIGTEILRRLLRRAAHANRALSLHVLRANPRAVALYAREGLRVVREEETRFLMRSKNEGPRSSP